MSKYPLAESGAKANGSGSMSYRWSNRVSSSDAEIIGPFENVQQFIDVALSRNETDPVARGDIELTMHRLLIRCGTFIKIMHSHSDGKYYTIFFPVSKVEECGQQLAREIFTSKIEAQNHAIKMNSFRRLLLNKCEEEFNEHDIYTDWKVEKKEYEKDKANLSESEQKEMEEELEFRRMDIKKRMSCSIVFIGELYNLGMIKEKIIRYCIHSLFKIEDYQGVQRSKSGEDGEMDEEDHQSICNLFNTIGKTFDKR